MFDNGFITGRHADLSWHGAADARRLAILLAASAAAAMLGSHIRRASQGPLPAPGPAAAAPAVTTAASDEPNDDGVPMGHSRLAA